MIQPVIAVGPIRSGNKLALDAKKQIGVTVSYGPAYRQLDFPRGDLPLETGVCVLTSSSVLIVYKIVTYSSWSIMICNPTGQAIQRLGV